MRVVTFLFLLAGFAAADEDKVRSEEHNFEIAVPKDWEVREPVPDKHIRAHLYTYYADTDPLVEANVYVMAYPLDKTYARKAVPELAEIWRSSLEGFLENPHDRTTTDFKIGSKDARKVDVKGNVGSGIFRRTYVVTRMGPNLYVVVMDRNLQAATDDGLDTELGKIVESFRFLREVKDEVAKEGVEPGAGGPGPQGKKPEDKGPQIPKEKLEKADIVDEFWRFKALKPEGLWTEDANEEEQKTGVKLKILGRTPADERLLIRVYVDTEQGKKYTIETLAKTYIETFKTHFKDPREPKIEERLDRSWPLSRIAKEALVIDLVGRRVVTERLKWVMVEGDNERQYRIEILLQGAAAPQKFDDTVALFLRNFKPLDK